jgi:cyclase
LLESDYEENPMRFVRVCALLCFAGLAAAAALADAQFFDVSQVADGVYAAIGKNGAFCNAAVVVNKNDVLVVDTHLRPVWAHDLIQQIKKMTDKPVRYVVDTHWHPDHVQGNEAYVNVFGPTVEYLAQHNTRDDMIHKAIPSIQDSLKEVPEGIAKMEQALADGKDAQGQPLTDDAREPQEADRRPEGVPG